MSTEAHLTWHNLDGLQALCNTCSTSEYVTIATLANDRRESQIARMSVQNLTEPYTTIVDRLQARVPQEGLPQGGRLRFRVRQWGSRGHPLGGVVVRIEPGGAPPRRRRTSRPIPAHLRSRKKPNVESLEREIQRLNDILTTERLEWQGLREELFAARLLARPVEEALAQFKRNLETVQKQRDHALMIRDQAVNKLAYRSARDEQQQRSLRVSEASRQVLRLKLTNEQVRSQKLTQELEQLREDARTREELRRQRDQSEEAIKELREEARKDKEQIGSLSSEVEDLRKKLEEAEGDLRRATWKPPEVYVAPIEANAGIETDYYHLWAQRTSVGEFWYYKNEHVNRLTLQSEVVELLSKPVRDRDEETSVPFHAALLLAASLLVGVPAREGGNEGDRPIKGLDRMAVLRWTAHFLATNGLGAADPQSMVDEHEKHGREIPLSERRPGDVVYCYEDLNRYNYTLYPMILLPGDRLFGVWGRRIVVRDTEVEAVHILRPFTPIDWPKEKRSGMDVTPGTWLQLALVDAYRSRSGVVGVQALYNPEMQNPER